MCKHSPQNGFSFLFFVYFLDLGLGFCYFFLFCYLLLFAIYFFIYPIGASIYVILIRASFLICARLDQLIKYIGIPLSLICEWIVVLGLGFSSISFLFLGIVYLPGSMCLNWDLCAGFKVLCGLVVEWSWVFVIYLRVFNVFAVL